MLIEYCSPSPRAGQREHKQPVIAETLIAAGFAIRVIDANAPALGAPGDAVVPFAAKPTWTIGSGPGGQLCIIRFNAGETLWFDGPPNDASYHCPKEIVDQWKKIRDPKKAEAIAEANRKSRAEAEAGTRGTRMR